MPLAYRIDAESQTIFWVLEGAVSDEELLNTVQIMRADPEYRPQYARLIDTTRANPSRLTGDAIGRIAAANSQAHVGKCALIAVADAMYGMARMYELYCDGVACQVFRDRSAALAWLAGYEPASNAVAVRSASG